MWTPTSSMPFPAFLAAAAPAALNFLGGMFGAGQQSRANMRLAQYQHQANMQMMHYQNRYNSPKAQMRRFAKAGLNPHLVYGQGTPGNMESPPRFPQIAPADFQSPFSDLGLKFQQSRLLAAQADLTDQKVEESGIKQDLMRAQEDLVRANPNLNKAYVDSMVRNLKSVADLKEQEAGFMLSKTQSDVDGQRWERGFLKMQRELDILEQRFKLSQADQKVKAEIIESKEFQNMLSEIQVKWMKDADVSPEHIRQGIMLLMSKFMSK